ncbi:hypothetical protein ZIOFF_023369 [Zingiber officinale]|uniref:biotin carboxylase n=1 Tax=Zingiber officinale TaxID=94328 RepID=A0A8J5LFK7_ZINOF|nr:hypothetical protein ZIOFF_023369 [Zingiber officinale]
MDSIVYCKSPSLPTTGLFPRFAGGIKSSRCISRLGWASNFSSICSPRRNARMTRRSNNHGGALCATCQAEKILVANRGEIAVRVIRTAHEMGIPCVAVHSTIDQEALHVRLADEAVCIGEGPSSQSYLVVENVLAAAINRGCTMLHPGYGFLSENANFVDTCKQRGINFIGPNPDSIRVMGDKATARETMKNAGVPTVPGSEGLLQSTNEAVKLANEIGFPVMIKATAGGGGRGMRLAKEPEEFVKLLQAIEGNLGRKVEWKKRSSRSRRCYVVGVTPNEEIMSELSGLTRGAEVAARGTKKDLDGILVNIPLSWICGRRDSVITTQGIYEQAKSEAQVAFGNDGVYLEKYIQNPRHIEFQVLADKYGNVVHFGERDCSIQRRNQKLLEEAPSPALNPELRKAMGDAAVAAAASIGYVGVGTIEFLLDERGSFYFMEMNTRIQVEHPVTEMISSTDLIEEQIRVALGERLRYKQEDIVLRGHSIECRINAEDAFKGFRPGPGKITSYLPSGGPFTRMDSHVYPGYVVPPTYDSLLGKLIVWAPTREKAIERMKRALDDTVITGIPTTIDYHKLILEIETFIQPLALNYLCMLLNPQDFKKGKVDTAFIPKHEQELAVVSTIHFTVD